MYFMFICTFFNLYYTVIKKVAIENSDLFDMPHF